MKPTRTLLRGLEALDVLARSRTPVGPTRLAEELDLDKATAGRLLYTLCVGGYARQLAGGTYTLTSKLLQLGSGVSLDGDLRAVAKPHLEALRDATDETVHLGMREGDRVIYIDKIEGRHPIRLVSAVGQDMPLHTTALGKAALAWMGEAERERILATLVLAPRTEHSITDLPTLRAELERTRARGFAVDARENEEHAYCIGAPVLDADGGVAAMISLSGPSYRVGEQVEELGAQVRQAAARISADFAGAVTG